MSRVKKEERKNQKVVYSDSVYTFVKGRKKPIIRRDVNVIGKIRLDTPIALLEMNGKREVFKDNLTSITDSAMTQLFKVMNENKNVKNKRKYAYIVQDFKRNK